MEREQPALVKQQPHRAAEQKQADVAIGDAGECVDNDLTPCEGAGFGDDKVGLAPQFAAEVGDLTGAPAGAWTSPGKGSSLAIVSPNRRIGFMLAVPIARTRACFFPVLGR
jgi:hypothetical protein